MDNIFLPNQRIIILQGLEKDAAGGRERSSTDLTVFPPARDFADAKLAENEVCLRAGHKTCSTQTSQRVFARKLGRTASTVKGRKYNYSSPQLRCAGM